MICSRTLHRMHVREIGRQFAASDLSPFLKIGVTLALHQSAGSLPVCNDLLKITLIIGASSTLSSSTEWVVCYPSRLPYLV